MKSLLILTVGALLACPVISRADDSTNTPPPGPPPGGEMGHHHGMDFLTDAEKAELKKAHDAAVVADPTLADKPTGDDREAMHAYREKMDAAMIKADPAVEPIIEKIKAHHHGPGGPGGPGGPPPASGT